MIIKHFYTEQINHISQVLEYYGKFRKTKIYDFSINFLAKKKNSFFHLRKIQNNKFLVISKYNLSINFLAQKRPSSHLWKFQNNNFPVISKYHLSINFLAQKDRISISGKFKNKNFWVISKHGIPYYRKYDLIGFLGSEKLSVLVLKISCKFRKY